MPNSADTTNQGTLPLLECDQMGVFIQPFHHVKWLIKDISVSIRQGEIVAVIGESGSGKTTLLRSVTRLFPGGSHPANSGLHLKGSLAFEGKQISSLSVHELRELRTHRIRYIFQEPGSVLNPLLTIGKQFHVAGIDSDEANKALSAMQLTEPDQLLTLYPHQLSVGMLQRISMAMALHGNPTLILADEPTGAVDASLRKYIMQLLTARCREGNSAMLIATHDLNIVSAHADTVVVMLRGRIVERAPAIDFFQGPLHPYSQALLEWSRASSLPKPGTRAEMATDWNTGCVYADACSKVHDDCTAGEIEMQHPSTTRDVRCLYWK